MAASNVKVTLKREELFELYKICFSKEIDTGIEISKEKNLNHSISELENLKRGLQEKKHQILASIASLEED